MTIKDVLCLADEKLCFINYNLKVLNFGYYTVDNTACFSLLLPRLYILQLFVINAAFSWD